METKKKERVLFVCTHNSARSQMAEGLMNALHADRYDAYSAGTHPAAVNPHSIKALAEIGIDISKSRAKGLGEYAGQKFDYVVTVCGGAQEECPFFPGAKKQIHAGFDDPSAVKGSEEEIMAAFRRARDEIKEWMEKECGKKEEQ
ncbi:MAG: arsenate reductase ArsC [Candidatus Altiarchaeia archaeon]